MPVQGQGEISCNIGALFSYAHKRIEARLLKRSEHVLDAQATQETLIIVISAQHTPLLLMV